MFNYLIVQSLKSSLCDLFLSFIHGFNFKGGDFFHFEFPFILLFPVKLMFKITTVPLNMCSIQRFSFVILQCLETVQ